MKKEHFVSIVFVIGAVLWRINLTNDYTLYHHTSFSFFSGIIGFISLYTENKTIRAMFFCAIPFVILHNILMFINSFNMREFYLHLIHFVPFIIGLFLKRFKDLGLNRMMISGIFDSFYIYIYGIIFEDYNFRMKEFVGDSTILLFLVLLLIGCIPSTILWFSIQIRKHTNE